MTALAQYYVPGRYIEDHAIDVPLDWRGDTPGKTVSGETIRLFYRVVCEAGHEQEDLPLLLFLQGGPGGAGPRPMGHDGGDAWLAEALKHFRVVLPDQRGTGRSSRIDSHAMRRIEGAPAQAEYLKRFLADSIIRDFEHLRLTAFGGRKWVTLGQSYGGFLTLSYLSLFPQGLAACFTNGGIPHVPADPDDVYAHTFPRMESKTMQYYARYPQDRERVAAVADRVAQGGVALPNGDPLTVERIQTLGGGFGMKPSFEQIHWLFDEAFVDGDGSADSSSPLSDEFLTHVMDTTASRPLYWPLQEFIYADGELEHPVNWAAQRAYDTRPQFSVSARPLLFTGEAIFPWMFRQEQALHPFAAAMDILMQDTHFGKIYDADQLARNEVPLQATVYVDDMYVDSTLQLDTLSRVGNSHYWATNEYEHDGLRTDPRVFTREYREALGRGDLAGIK